MGVILCVRICEARAAAGSMIVISSISWGADMSGDEGYYFIIPPVAQQRT
jgi:hypothetical protein